MKIVIGILIAFGIAFSWLSIVEVEERKKIAEYEKLVERMRKLP